MVMKGYVMSALGILALILFVMLWMDRYYPQVDVELPDHSRLTIIDRPWAKAQKCHEENEKLISAMQAFCKQCKLAGRCLERVAPSWQKALEGGAIDAYVVHSGSMRILVEAGNLSKQTCIAMAEQISREKRQPAKCVWKRGG
jgi:hypothetical protein